MERLFWTKNVFNIQKVTDNSYVYPRQNEDFELSVRYVYIPRITGAYDTPELLQSIILYLRMHA